MKTLLVGVVVCVALASSSHAEAKFEWEVGATGETIFEHTRASLRDPHFGMRLYRGAQIPGTLHPVSDPTSADADARAATADHEHTFWDVAFGERMPVVSLYNVNRERARYARGLQLNLDAGVFMLLDFTSQSSGVIDTDFRLGASIDVRPWRDGWDRLSLSVGFFHESTHLGDEYVLSAGTIQAGAKPTANPALYYRANPSYEGLPVTLSYDEPISDHLTGRVYGGASAFFWSALPNGAFPSEWRAGAELRWTMVAEDRSTLLEPTTTPAPPSLPARVLNNVVRRSAGTHDDEHVVTRRQGGRKRRGPFAVELAYELLEKRRYRNVDGDVPGGTATFASASGFWAIQHATLVGLYNLDTEHSSSNAVGLSLDWLRGRSPFGQLVEYSRVDTIAFGVSYYW